MQWHPPIFALKGCVRTPFSLAMSMMNAYIHAQAFTMSDTSDDNPQQAENGRVFELAAELFGVLATPMRLRILSALCNQEKSVSQLLGEIETTQPNLSQHLNVLYRTGVLAKRKEGTQVIYRVQSEQAVTLCRTVCTQIAIELDEPGVVPQAQRLLPRIAS